MLLEGLKYLFRLEKLLFQLTVSLWVLYCLDVNKEESNKDSEAILTSFTASCKLYRRVPDPQAISNLNGKVPSYSICQC